MKGWVSEWRVNKGEEMREGDREEDGERWVGGREGGGEMGEKERREEIAG